MRGSGVPTPYAPFAESDALAVDCHEPDRPPHIGHADGATAPQILLGDHAGN